MIIYLFIYLCIIFLICSILGSKGRNTKKNRSIFGSNENFKICIRDLLTFNDWLSLMKNVVKCRQFVLLKKINVSTTKKKCCCCCCWETHYFFWNQSSMWDFQFLFGKLLIDVLVWVLASSINNYVYSYCPFCCLFLYKN